MHASVQTADDVTSFYGQVKAIAYAYALPVLSFATGSHA